LQQNDIIVEFGGVAVRSQGELLEAVEQQPIGSQQRVVALRKGERKSFSVKVEAFPEQELLRRRRLVPSLDNPLEPDVENTDDKDNTENKGAKKKDNTKKKESPNK